MKDLPAKKTTTTKVYFNRMTFHFPCRTIRQIYIAENIPEEDRKLHYSYHPLKEVVYLTQIILVFFFCFNC